MTNKHYHVFHPSGQRLSPVIEVPIEATSEEVVSELLVTHAETLPALLDSESIRFLERGQTLEVYGPAEQICMLVRGL